MKTTKRTKTKPKFKLNSAELAMDNDSNWQSLDPSSAEYAAIADQVAVHSAETKEARVTTRLNARDLALLKQKAAELGLAYQSLLSSLIHRYVSGRLVDIEDAKIAMKIWAGAKR